MDTPAFDAKRFVRAALRSIALFLIIVILKMAMVKLARFWRIDRKMKYFRVVVLFLTLCAGGLPLFSQRVLLRLLIRLRVVAILFSISQAFFLM